MDSSKFNVGDTVTLSSHPYNNNFHNIIISGDGSHLPPLLVIKEVFATSQNLPPGNAAGQHYKCICVYYSSHNSSFKEITVMDTDIKQILVHTDLINHNLLKRGELVRFITTGYELHKRKSSLTYEENQANSDVNRLSINPLLSYLPPVMQVLNWEINNSKLPLSNKKTNETIRWITSINVTCAYFNPIKDSITEISLPVESLELIPKVNEEYLFLINESIDKNSYLLITKDNIPAIIKPNSINSRVGDYYIRGFDLLLNRNREFKINSSEICIEKMEKYFLNTVPQFDKTNISKSLLSSSILQELKNSIETAKENSSYIRIQYKNRNNEISYRTLSHYELYNLQELDTYYLRGFCLLRQEPRLFKLLRIQHLMELNLKFEHVQ